MEYVRYTLELNSTQPNSTGPSLYGTSLLSIPLERHVSSLFGEVLIPEISVEAFSDMFAQTLKAGYFLTTIARE